MSPPQQLMKLSLSLVGGAGHGGDGPGATWTGTGAGAAAIASRVVMIDKGALMQAACSSGSFNPFDLAFGAFNAAVDAGISREHAPVVAQALVAGIRYDPVAESRCDVTLPANDTVAAAAPPVRVAGRRVAQDIICAVPLSVIPAPCHGDGSASDDSALGMDVEQDVAVDADDGTAPASCDCCRCRGCDIDHDADTRIQDKTDDAHVAASLLDIVEEPAPVPADVDVPVLVLQRRRSIGSGRYIMSFASASAAAAPLAPSAPLAARVAAGLAAAVRAVPLRRLARRPSKPYARPAVLLRPRISIYA